MQMVVKSTKSDELRWKKKKKQVVFPFYFPHELKLERIELHHTPKIFPKYRMR